LMIEDSWNEKAPQGHGDACRFRTQQRSMRTAR
jgi:hypothetical protein